MRDVRRSSSARRDDDALRVICCHLGAGASLCATRGGRSVDTTMGWTPLEGLVMATRSGSVDPGVVLALVRHLGVDAVERALDADSGLAGLSGIPGGDLRAVLAARAAGDAAATLAFDVYVHRLRREIAAMVASAAVSTCSSSPAASASTHPRFGPRRAMRWVSPGVWLDPVANTALEGEGEIGAPGSPVRSLVIPAREDVEIARQVRATMGAAT